MTPVSGDPTFVEYAMLSLAIRELANGMWTVSSLFVAVISAVYLYKEAKGWGWKWRAMVHDHAMQFAAAWCILIVGHCIRSAASWGEFVSIRTDRFTDFWLFASGEPFIAATAIVITGKLLCIYVLANPSRRWFYMGATLAVTLCAPTAVYLLLDGGQGR